jgi:hypothetical protein
MPRLSLVRHSQWQKNIRADFPKMPEDVPFHLLDAEKVTIVLKLSSL